MKFGLGMTGGLLVVLALNSSLVDESLGMALAFFGASLCLGSLVLTFCPLLEVLITYLCIRHYERKKQAVMAKHQEDIQRHIEEVRGSRARG